MRLSETLATLEGIQKADRGQYFASVKPKVNFEEEEFPDGTIKIGISMEPNNSLHPGLHAIVIRWRTEAIKLGARFMRCPRIGTPKPPQFIDSDYVPETDNERSDRQDRFSKILQTIDSKSVGISVAKRIGDNINVRLDAQQPWFANLDSPLDIHEERSVERAIGEWADGDTVAAHYAYRNDLLCSEDIAKSAAGNSIFEQSIRTEMAEEFGIKFVTINELAARL